MNSIRAWFSRMSLKLTGALSRAVSNPFRWVLWLGAAVGVLFLLSAGGGLIRACRGGGEDAITVPGHVDQGKNLLPTPEDAPKVDVQVQPPPLTDDKRQEVLDKYGIRAGGVEVRGTRRGPAVSIGTVPPGAAINPAPEVEERVDHGATRAEDPGRLVPGGLNVAGAVEYPLILSEEQFGPGPCGDVVDVVAVLPCPGCPVDQVAKWHDYTPPPPRTFENVARLEFEVGPAILKFPERNGAPGAFIAATFDSVRLKKATLRGRVGTMPAWVPQDGGGRKLELAHMGAVTVAFGRIQ